VSRAAKPKPAEITDRFIRAVSGRLAENKRVRRNLPLWGRVHVDRALPFLCVYRRPTRGRDEGTNRLVTAEASYLSASGASRLHPGLSSLVRSIATTLSAQFGTFLIVEVWASHEDVTPPPEVGEATPGFRLFVPDERRLDALADAFEGALSRIRLLKRRAEVRAVRGQRCRPPRTLPLVTAEEAREADCVTVGVEVRPVYRSADGDDLYPLRLRPFRRQLSRALQRSFFEFSRHYTTHRPRNYHMLGKRAMVKAVWEVDRQLSDVADRFDLLLQVTPVNATRAWNRFKRARFEGQPSFRYRPVPVDPVLLKRKLYAVPLERVEDPAVALLLRQKQEELDRQLNMLLDLNTRRFLHESIQLYGGVDDHLMRTAKQILRRLPARTREDSRGGFLDAEAFARRAEEEIDWYRAQWPDVDASVQVRGDVNSGLLVSRGSLLVGSHTKIPVSRVNALIQHEVGTHVLTYYNGRAQPLRQLYSGLAGYEALQEGLAVLAEYLVGGLSRPRLRLLAARVLVTRRMIEGASFTDSYRELNRTHGLQQHSAFTVVMRVYRGGGLTKDAVYLRGLDRLLGYLNGGGALDPLYIGKIATGHVPIVEELLWRRVLRPAPLSPRYMSQPGVSERLERVRRYASVLDLVKEEYR
jgi:uncharacterized protein (TIGR02421 family)